MASTRELRDGLLADDIREVLGGHPSLNGLPLSIRVHGGVAHLRGVVPSESELRLLRKVVGRIRGVHAVWDIVGTRERPEPSLVDLGCGNKKQCAEAIGVDCHRHPAVGVLAQAEQGLPFGESSIDHLFAVHFLEHVRDLIGVMNEIHRVLRPGGVLHLMVPNWQYVNAVADPTHVRFFHPQTFKFFCRPYPGLREFRPLSIAATTEDLFADLEPIKHGEAANTEAGLARYFE